MLKVKNPPIKIKASNQYLSDHCYAFVLIINQRITLLTIFIAPIWEKPWSLNNLNGAYKFAKEKHE